MDISLAVYVESTPACSSAQFLVTGDKTRPPVILNLDVRDYSFLLINYLIDFINPTHSYKFFLVMTTFKIYSPSNFQI